MRNDGVVIDDELSVSYFTTPLAIATLHGRDAFLRTLLRKGVPPDQNFKHTQWTPLMIAALTGGRLFFLQMSILLNFYLVLDRLAWHFQMCFFIQ